MVEKIDLKDKPFLVKVIIYQMVGESGEIQMKIANEFTYGRDIIATLSNLYNEVIKFVDWKIIPKDRGLVVKK